MEEQEFRIPIDEPKAEFKKHLELPHNKRILFSAPFGTGKTYFLDKFFKDRPEKVIRLYPVNYSVSSNEDVFELIKFDILFQLLEDEGLVLEKVDFTPFFVSQFYLINNAGGLFEWVLRRFGKTGKSLVEYAKTIEKLVNEYKKFKGTVNSNHDESFALNYLLNIKHSKGTPYEEDVITKLIQSFLQQLCDEERKSVLIIDDLDRIDPEHIFRLLNVFAAHFDIGKPDTNKFGFDKVIFVCDVNNIRNIFHAKYGTETDFTGYIDKFFSTEVYSFNSENRYINFFSRDTITRFYSLSFTNNSDYLRYTSSQGFFEIFKTIIIELSEAGAINLRAIKKLFIEDIHLKSYKLNFKFLNYYGKSNQSYVITVFEILKRILGDYKSVEVALKKASLFFNKNVLDEYNSTLNSSISNYIFEHTLPLLVIGQAYSESINNDRDNAFEYYDRDLDIKFVAVENERSDLLYLKIKNIKYSSVRQERNYSSNYYILLANAFKKLQSYGHLKD